MAVVEALLGRTIRKEMKKRVDQVIKAGSEWNESAKNLTDALNKLTIAIEEGKVDPSILKPIASATKRLAKKTGKLEKRFASYEQSLNKLIPKFG